MLYFVFWFVNVNVDPLVNSIWRLSLQAMEFSVVQKWQAMCICNQFEALTLQITVFCTRSSFIHQAAQNWSSRKDCWDSQNRRGVCFFYKSWFLPLFYRFFSWNRKSSYSGQTPKRIEFVVPDSSRFEVWALYRKSCIALLYIIGKFFALRIARIGDCLWYKFGYSLWVAEAMQCIFNWWHLDIYLYVLHVYVFIIYRLCLFL